MNILNKEFYEKFEKTKTFLKEQGLCLYFDPFDKTPIVFETMVFDGDRSDIYQERYATWKEAEDGHKRAIEWVKNGCKEDE